MLAAMFLRAASGSILRLPSILLRHIAGAGSATLLCTLYMWMYFTGRMP